MNPEPLIGRFADVILPIPLPAPLTYRIPLSMGNRVVPGIRVSIPLGSSRIYAGMVRKVHGLAPGYTTREILDIIDETPVADETHLQFWEWMASYYLCHTGEVMNAALPMPARSSSEALVSLTPDIQYTEEQQSEYEYRILTALRERDIPVSEIMGIAGLRKVRPVLDNLLEKGLIRMKMDWQDEYRPKTQGYLELSEEFKQGEALSVFLDTAGRKAPKQLDCMLVFLHLGAGDENASIAKKQLRLDPRVSPAALNALLSKGVLVESELEESRFSKVRAVRKQEDIAFNEHQDRSLSEIRDQFLKKQVVLLHGVTGSGKTEMYIRLMHETIAEGKQVLFLVPEIALTSQLVSRLQEYFGHLVGVYHSRYSAAQRTEVWQRVRLPGDQGFPVVLGARSAIFLPFRNLGLIIVDEEHDSSYKQYDPAPRYHARDSAIYLASLCGARVVLGSATPSIESYYNARKEKFGLSVITRRFGQALLPEVFVADMGEAYRKRQVKSHFSHMLIEQISEALRNKQQVILFQNRRGYSLRLECEHCHWMPQCRHCDVTLIYHKAIGKLKCHYCGYSIKPPQTCDSCGGSKLLLKGFGTEQIEDELPALFPGVSVARLDLDTTRSRNSYTRTIGDFEKGKIDILVGTQMVSKGLDFDNVGVVGIMNADNMLNFPDFRAFERSYQHLAQVSGRAGRKDRKGKVVIQTFQPYHPIIRQVMVNDFEGMYADQVLERRNFHYPPFIRLIRVTFLHKDQEQLKRTARELSQGFRTILGKEQVLGPEFPLITRMKGLYQRQTLIKLPRENRLGSPKRQIMNYISEYSGKEENKGLRVVVDVDPV